jgi:hypothetical protein
MGDDEVLRRLHVDDLVDLVKLLRRDYAAAVADAESTVEIGGQVMTQAQYEAARFPLVEERDRLRAVVDAAHELLDEDRTSWSPWHAQLADALAALDVSPDTGGDE